MKISEVLGEIPHPGEFIQDELDAREWTQCDLADISGIDPQTLDMLMSGKRAISPDIARSLSKAFGISVEYFLNMQKAHDSSVTPEADTAIRHRARL